MKTLIAILVLSVLPIRTWAKSRLFIKPSLISTYASFESQVDGGSAIKGTIASNGIGYGGEVEVGYQVTRKLVLSGSYRVLSSNSEYSQSNAFSGDDNWKKNWTFTTTDIFLNLGYAFKKSFLKLGFSPVSELKSSNFIIEGTDSINFNGSTILAEFNYSISNRTFFGIGYSLTTFSKVVFDNESSSLPATNNNIEYKSASLSQLSLSLGFIF